GHARKGRWDGLADRGGLLVREVDVGGPRGAAARVHDLAAHVGGGGVGFAVHFAVDAKAELAALGWRQTDDRRGNDPRAGREIVRSVEPVVVAVGRIVRVRGDIDQAGLAALRRAAAGGPDAIGAGP